MNHDNLLSRPGTGVTEGGGGDPSELKNDRLVCNMRFVMIRVHPSGHNVRANSLDWK